jgi:hypothetical protein
MQTNQKVIEILNQEWILNECHKVQGLWITEKGCQIARSEAERYCGVFKTLQEIESLSGLSRFVESNKLRKIFQCGDCPKYGAPCANFEDVLSYIIEVQAATANAIAAIDLGMPMEEDSAELPEGFIAVPQAVMDADSEEEDQTAETEEDLL